MEDKIYFEKAMEVINANVPSLTHKNGFFQPKHLNFILNYLINVLKKEDAIYCSLLSRIVIKLWNKDNAYIREILNDKLEALLSKDDNDISLNLLVGLIRAQLQIGDLPLAILKYICGENQLVLMNQIVEALIKGKSIAKKLAAALFLAQSGKVDAKKEENENKYRLAWITAIMKKDKLTEFINAILNINQPVQLKEDVQYLIYEAFSNIFKKITENEQLRIEIIKSLTLKEFEELYNKLRPYFKRDNESSD